MTLIIGWSQPEGIYMSVDYRVTDSRSGRVLDDQATKHLEVHWGPLIGATKGLFAYTGVAILPDGTPTGTWLRETLRGEVESPAQSLAHLRDRCRRDFSRLGHALMINVLITEGSRRYFAGISNVYRGPKGVPIVRRDFGLRTHELHDPLLFFNGSGAQIPGARRILKRAEPLNGVSPRRPMNYMNLLAIMNRQIAEKDKRVSPFCQVAFVPQDGSKFQPQSHPFTQRGEVLPRLQMALITSGIDLHFMAEHMLQRMIAHEAGEEAPPLDRDEVNRRQQRRP